MDAHSIERAVAFWRCSLFDSMDYVLLLPSMDDRVSDLIISAFNDKLNGRSGTIIQGKQAMELIGLYSVYAFTDKVIVGSFREPHGRKLLNLLNSGIATEEELINDVILGAM